MIVSFTLDGHPAGVHAADISMILPDIARPDRSVIYTGVFPSGFTVDQKPIDLIVAWSNALAEVTE